MEETKFKVGQKLYQGPYWVKIGKEKYVEINHMEQWRILRNEI